jgi:hypothetical protein
LTMQDFLDPGLPCYDIPCNLSAQPHYIIVLSRVPRFSTFDYVRSEGSERMMRVGRSLADS